MNGLINKYPEEMKIHPSNIVIILIGVLCLVWSLVSHETQADVAMRRCSDMGYTYEDCVKFVQYITGSYPLTQQP